MTAEEIAEASGLPLWVVKEKLGIKQKHITDPAVHPNRWRRRRPARPSTRRASIRKEIDVVLCTTEEWKEYNLWTAGIDLAHEIGATNAWGMDMHMRCATTIAALKLARSLMRDDADDRHDPDRRRLRDRATSSTSPNLRTSFLFNIGAGAGAMIVKRDWPENHVLGTHLMSDGSMSRHVIVPASGTVEHPTDDAVAGGDFKFDLVEPEAMKARLGEVTIDNWMHCVDEALRKSGTKSDGTPYTRADLDYLNMLLVKPSAHQRDPRPARPHRGPVRLHVGDVGHIGEQDSIISMIEGGRSRARLKPGDLMVIVGAGIGYVWGAGVVQWGSPR